MRLAPVPENLLEQGLLALGVLPTPLMDTMVALLLARTVMAATRFGVFDALAGGPRTAVEVAATCHTDPTATGKLLFALAGAGYAEYQDGRYTLAAVSRQWLLRRGGLRDAVLHRYLDAMLLEHTEAYLETGRPVDFHRTLSPEQWEVYQRGQRAHAALTATEVAARAPAPAAPRAMLDIGGGHGHYSVAFCRHYPGLHATVLDLPAAVEAARPFIAREGLEDRIRHRADDALRAELGEVEFDLVLIANLAHHFSADQNRDLLRRAARALRPGGVCLLLEMARPDTPAQAGQVGALTEFYFALTSASGTWSYAEMAAWQSDAGLRPLVPVRLLLSPGYGLQAAEKP